jgi:CRP/FNR family transcriptional regulator, cyclic AMP receptor protein
METLERVLVEHPFFEGLDRPYVQLIVGCATNVRFERGELLFREGEEANRFYIIRHGRVALTIFSPQQGPLTIETVGDGEVLGWSWLVPPYHWHFSARAEDMTRAIALDGKCLRTKCEEDHTLGFQLMKRFAHIIQQRLQATRLQLLDLYGAQAERTGDARRGR